MKKSILLFLVILLGGGSLINAQPVPPATGVNIGDFENYTLFGVLPMNPNWNYSLSQQIYKSEEIGMPGRINAITLWLLGSMELEPHTFDIYAKEVDKEEFAHGLDWESVTSEDMVWSGTILFNNLEAEPYTFTFDTPFEYSGSRNLLLCFYDHTGSFQSGFSGLVFELIDDPAIRALVIYNDDMPYDPANMVLPANNESIYRNLINIDITPLSVTENYGNLFTMYPNPASDNVIVDSDVNVDRYDVYNVLGEKVFGGEVNAESFNLNVKALPSGTYIIRLMSDGMVHNRKFIKE